jgi:hypothetical protein
MKKQILALLCVVFLVGGLAAQKPQVRTVDPTEANLRRHIEYLASDKLEGRRTGEQGATLAAGYIASQFANLKLKPGVQGKKGKPSYLQPYPYITGVELAKTGNSFTLGITRGGTRMTLRDGLQLTPAGFSPNGTVTDAPVTLVGYGITSKDLKFDDYQWNGKDLDVQGDVVIVFVGVPDNDNPHSPYQRYDLRTKALIAKDHGAVGMLVISREAKFEDDKLTRMGYDQSLGEAAVPTFIISRDAAMGILGATEEDLKTMEGLIAMKTQPGVKVHVGHRDTHPSVSFSVNLVKRSVSAFNVIGVIEGTDPVLKKEAIVIGAHYDHLGHGGAGSLAANSTEIHHGADDNASGTAAIIELARLFAKKHENKRTLVFIGFSGEEEGLFGSNYYVNNPIFPLDKTVAMINLDMVGRLKDDKLTIGGMGTASEWKQIVEYRNQGNEFGKSVTPIVTPVPKIPMEAQATTTVISHTSVSMPQFNLQLNEDGFGPSDHSSFYGKKIPVLFFFTGTHNDYHKPSDTADKINYAGEHHNIQYIQSIIKAIDANPQRPTYTVAKTTMQGGRTGFNISLGTIPNYADSTDGLLLDGVRDGSPAARAGMKAGDKVVKLAGHDIRNVMDYTFVLGEMRAGEEYEIVVMRGTERLSLKIVPVKR